MHTDREMSPHNIMCNYVVKNVGPARACYNPRLRIPQYIFTHINIATGVIPLFVDILQGWVSSSTFYCCG